jgi:2-methylcitrate dehydratase PrpD
MKIAENKSMPASLEKTMTDRNTDSGKEGLTHQVARFILETSYADIPAAAIEAGKKSILDGLGLALSGSAARSGHYVQTYLRSLGVCDGPASVIGTDLKAPARFAAFANATAIHADDFDDTQLAVGKDRVYGLLTHPTAPCLPAALANAEMLGCSGAETMLAYHIGLEVDCKIAEAIDPRHYQNGFHATATCGPFAAAAASAKLRGFDLDKILRALSIAGSQSGGLRENFGTMTKPFHAGRAAEAGVVAAEFAGLGWTATDRILEAPRGFFQAAGGGYDSAAICGKLGNPWTFIFPGVSIKPHPSGSLTHPGMTEMLHLIRAHHISADMVARVDVGANRNMPTALIHHYPQNELQAKFSMEFCMAILLLDGKAGLPQFTDETVRRADVKATIEKIHFDIDPEAEAAGYDKMTTIITIPLKDGRVISGRADFGKGSPANPMSYDEVAEKFRGCAEQARWPDAAVEKIIACVRALDTVKDIRELSRLCIRR